MRTILTKPGRVFKFRQTQFWAEQGLVHFLDYRESPYNPHYRSVGMRELVELIKAFRDMVPHFKYPDERREHEQLVEDLLAAGCAAKAQGDPHNPEVSAYKARHRSRKSHFLVPVARPAEGRVLFQEA
jgi:hypothetical protein